MVHERRVAPHGLEVEIGEGTEDLGLGKCLAGHLTFLRVDKMNNLNNVLCIVIRYFGKILLGASGLVRAYTKSVTECLANHIKEYTLGYNVTIMFDYDNLNTINYLLKSDSVISKKFEKRVSYNINIDNDTFNKLKQLNNCEIIINKDIYL